MSANLYYDEAFLAEYSVCNDPELAPEGAAMLAAISGSFARCGYDVVTPEEPDFEGEIRSLRPGATWDWLLRRIISSSGIRISLSSSPITSGAGA
ncbi:protein of unknown function [Methanoculleus bourgensis]|uniref:Uncharacterized protein n=1 Tax=Methanoculleus bourgensis TaxID=83986 RepID=A0A0X3BL96_9EURY|nr:protein of unknown function [Methanoculleus bourgensis]